jgi:hypothetical protein
VELCSIPETCDRYFYSPAVRTAVRPIHPPTECEPGAFFMGVSQLGLGREGLHSHQCRAYESVKLHL